MNRSEDKPQETFYSRRRFIAIRDHEEDKIMYDLTLNQAYIAYQE